eukprot:COSAG06_NODE_34116_length_479_cov_1.039474_1_plen_23_part_10
MSVSVIIMRSPAVAPVHNGSGTG